MRFVLQALAITVLLSLTACLGESGNSLEGCFATKMNGEARVRVKTSAGKSFMKLQKNGEWTESYPLHPGTPEELSKLFGAKSIHIKSSLVADKGSLALFLVDPVPLEKKSKFQAVLLLVAGDVYRVACD